MKLAVVHDWLTGMRGGEKCLEVICRRFPDARLFTLLHRHGSTSAAIERMAITTSFLQRVPGSARHYRYLLPLMPRAVERLAIPADVDLVLCFSHAVAKGVKPPPGVPHVCYCFTPMRYAWHLRGDYFESREGHENPYAVFAGRLARGAGARIRDRLLDRIRTWDHETSNRVTHFVAASRTVARRIEECYGRTATVIYPPVDVDFYTPADVGREDYYLCVSALVPYKRIDLAIEAANLSRLPLVVIGAGPEMRRLSRMAGPTVQFLGWCSDEQILDHLRRCRALLFPGHEDFGIVPVEAQACGAPVIALGRGGATETVLRANEEETGTGVFFDQPTPAALSGAIDWLEQHPGRLCPRLARRQAQRFTAERFERELTDLLQRAACPVSPDR